MAIFYSPVEVLTAAVETEQGGRQFYEAVARNAPTLAVKELFLFLAAEEEKHERTFTRLCEKVRATPAELPYNWNDVVPYLKAISDSRFFLGPNKASALAASARSETEALEAALQFEKETLLFYIAIADLVAAEHHGVVEELVRQERQHVRKLSELRSTIQDRPGDETALTEKAGL